MAIATTIADTTVTGKLLTGVNLSTSQNIAATDTILEAFGYLQAQITQLPQGLVYSGTWNANTNTPTLASGTGTTGHFYIVSVAGSTNLDGITDWQVGDWAIFIESGATDTWQKIDNTSAITFTNLWFSILEFNINSLSPIFILLEYLSPTGLTINSYGAFMNNLNHIQLL